MLCIEILLFFYVFCSFILTKQNRNVRLLLLKLALVDNFVDSVQHGDSTNKPLRAKPELMLVLSLVWIFKPNKTIT